MCTSQWFNERIYIYIYKLYICSNCAGRPCEHFDPAGQCCLDPTGPRACAVLGFQVGASCMADMHSSPVNYLSLSQISAVTHWPGSNSQSGEGCGRVSVWQRLLWSPWLASDCEHPGSTTAQGYRTDNLQVSILDFDMRFLSISPQKAMPGWTLLCYIAKEGRAILAPATVYLLGLQKH